MKNTLVVVADLACFKAYKLDGDRSNRSPRLELLEKYDSADAHGKLVNKVTDLGGRFPRRADSSGGCGAMSDGERHNIELEMRKRMVRDLAQRLNHLARHRDVDRCLLAVSREINHQLYDELEPQVQAKIEKTVAADLTKIEPREILTHF